MELNRKILEEYVNESSFHEIPSLGERIRIKAISRLGDGISNDVHSLLLTTKGGERRRRLILKIYNDDSEKALREYEILSALKRSGFPVPHPYICEDDRRILGKPFIIMEEVRGKPIDRYIEKLNEKGEEKERRIQEVVKLFAETLAELHKLRWESLNLNRFDPPRDEYEYAERQSIALKFIADYFQRNFHMKVDDNNLVASIAWLQNNAKSNPCERYSIVHGDYSPSNVLVTDDGKAVVIDWEGAEIGDPLADVGYAYHFVRLVFGPRKINSEGVKLAEYFISNYERAFGEPINRSRLEFYKISAASKLAVFLDFFIRPRFILKNLKWTLLYPIFYWFLRGWRNYVKNFLKEHVFKLE